MFAFVGTQKCSDSGIAFEGDVIDFQNRIRGVRKVEFGGNDERTPHRVHVCGKDKALQLLSSFPESSSRASLEGLVKYTTERKN